MPNRWLYGPSTAVGAVEIDVRALLEKYGPVRPGFIEKTGFEHLFATREDQTAVDLAVTATEGLGDRWWNDQVDGLIYVSSTSTLVAPGDGHLLQARLGLGREIFLLDINDACTGFVRALVVADALLCAGQATAVLIAASDTYTKLYDPSDLKVSPLFSDGASAVILSASQLDTSGVDVPTRRWEILASSFLSEGEKAAELCISRGSERDLGQLAMNGGGVFNFVLRNIGSTLERLHTAAGSDQSDVVDWYVHQGSRAVVNAAEKAVNAAPDSLFRSRDYGNVVQSSLPFQIAKQGSLGEGVIGLLGFGVGLTMGGALVRQSRSM